MDLKDKFKKNISQQPTIAPVRRSGNGSFIMQTQNHNPNYINRPTPHSVKYPNQPYPMENQIPIDAFDIPSSEYEPKIGEISEPFQPIPQPLSETTIQEKQSLDEINDFLKNQNETPQQPIFHEILQEALEQPIPLPPEQLSTMHGFSEEQQSSPTDFEINDFFTTDNNNPYPQNKNTDLETTTERHQLPPNEKFDLKTQKENSQKFEDFLISLFSRYEIDKILIINNEIYTANFSNDEFDNEIFDEIVDEEQLEAFKNINLTNGYCEKIIDIDKRLKATASPITEHPTISVTKTKFNLDIDEDFVRLLFETINKGKNIVVLAPESSEFMFKSITDYLEYKLCAIINGPIGTKDNISFCETADTHSLKVILSICDAIDPDSTIIYQPNNIAESIKYMQNHKNCILFSSSNSPSNFINSEVMSSLFGFNEYNKILCSKSIDIVLSIIKTKNNSIKFTATQILLPSNKSNTNKIKRIVGEDGQIEKDKIYFYNVFEKELLL